MKKMISFILAAAMSAMVAVPAFAAAPEADTVRDGENVNTWTTSGQSDNFKDKMMTMIAYAPNGEGLLLTAFSTLTRPRQMLLEHIHLTATYQKIYQRQVNIP